MMELISDIQIIAHCTNVVSSFSYQSTRHLEMCFESLLYMVLSRTMKQGISLKHALVKKSKLLKRKWSIFKHPVQSTFLYLVKRL